MFSTKAIFPLFNKSNVHRKASNHAIFLRHEHQKKHGFWVFTAVILDSCFRTQTFSLCLYIPMRQLL